MIENPVLTPLRADPIREAEHRLVAEFVESTAGIQMPPSKRTLIETRLRKRQRALGFDNLREYIRFALEEDAGKAEQHNLLDALTTNKTDFYREQPHFDFLRRYLAQGHFRQSSPLKCWSAGCSSGEEPYTLAIELLEHTLAEPNFDFQITATDISTKCLQKAKNAVYHHDKIEVMDMSLRKRYLLRSRDPNDERVQIGPEARAHVTFEHFNLISGNWQRWESQFDVIFCRNVMIYFNNHDRAILAERFASALRPGGVLIIGHSESLIDQQERFSRLQPTVYRKG